MTRIGAILQNVFLERGLVNIAIETLGGGWLSGDREKHL